MYVCIYISIYHLHNLLIIILSKAHKQLKELKTEHIKWKDKWGKGSRRELTVIRPTHR